MKTAEKSKKQIVIFMREYLLMGGIETYVYEQAKLLKEKGALVIWVKHPKGLIDDSFKHIFYDGKTIVLEKLHRRKLKNIVREFDAEITIVTFHIESYAKADLFKRNFKLCPVHTFYFVPNFTGSMLYLEEAYEGAKREKVRDHMGQIIRKMQSGENIRYFSMKHIDKMTKNYQYSIEEYNDYYVPPRLSECDFDEERCRNLARRERFNLFTVSRFDFPHKGYVLGLIKAYAQLKEKYPRLELTIVGYGKDEDRIYQTLENLPANIREDIHLFGKASQDELNDYYADANLNISVAGCCSTGAKRGTLSIPARHFDYSCEVYGFLPESRPYIISEEPGEAVIPYIEAVLNMSEDEYCEKCRKGYEIFNDSSIKLRKNMLEIKNLKNVPTLSKGDVGYIYFNRILSRIKSKIRIRKDF